MKGNKKSVRRRRPPGLTPEEREQELIALAVDKVEERMLNGTATAAEYVHFLKLATQKQQLELEKTRRETELITAKAESVRSAKHTEELITEAMNMYRIYSGRNSDEDDEDEELQ